MVVAALIAWTLAGARVQDLRALAPEQELAKIARDTSEAAEFLRAEALLRAGRTADAAQAVAAFQAGRPASLLAPRARLLEADLALLRGEYAKGCQILSDLSSSPDDGAAAQAGRLLRRWLRSGLVPPAEAVRLAWHDPSIGDSTLRAAGEAVPSRPLVVLLPQTGPYAQIGKRVSRGAQLAAAEAGVPAVVVDEPVDPIQAALLARSVLRTVRPRAVVGPLLSNTATAVALEMARTAPDVPLLLPAATSPDVAALAPSAWQVNITTRNQGAAAARLARECARASEAFLLWPKGEFGESVADGFRQEFSRAGRVAWQREYPAGTSDFRPFLESLRRTAADLARQRHKDTSELSPVVFVPSESPSDAQALSAQAAQMGMKPRWIGASGWHSRQFLVETSGRMEGALLVTDNVPDESRPSWKTFAAAWKASESDAPDRLAALGWDASRIALLSKVPAEFEGAQAAIRMDAATRTNLAVGRLRVEKGAFRPATCAEP